MKHPLTAGKSIHYSFKFVLSIYVEIRAKAYNLLLAFLQSLETCSLKVILLSIETHNNFLEELLFISMLSMLKEASSFEVSKS